MSTARWVLGAARPQVTAARPDARPTARRQPEHPASSTPSGC